MDEYSIIPCYYEVWINMDDYDRIGILFGKLGYYELLEIFSTGLCVFFEIWIIMGYYTWIMG